MNELNHGPGKGDKDRSPGWRTNYDGIDWGDRSKPNGFRRGSMGQRKKYPNFSSSPTIDAPDTYDSEEPQT